MTPTPSYVLMNPIDRIISEFDKKFKSKPLKIKDGEVVQYPVGYSEVKQFIRHSFSSYQKELAEKVEGMRTENEGTPCGCDGECFASCNASFNAALDSVLALIRGEV